MKKKTPKFPYKYDECHRLHELHVSNSNVFKFTNRVYLERCVTKLHRYLKNMNQVIYDLCPLLLSQSLCAKAVNNKFYQKYFIDLLTNPKDGVAYYDELLAVCYFISKASRVLRHHVSVIEQHYLAYVKQPYLVSTQNYEIAEAYAMKGWELFHSEEMSKQDLTAFKASFQDTCKYIRSLKHDADKLINNYNIMNYDC